MSVRTEVPATTRTGPGGLVGFCRCGFKKLEMLESWVTLESSAILPVKSH